MMKKMKTRPCELCNADATVFCPSDAAFLCCCCDAKVHGANFLVARHLRRPVCSNCKNFTGDIVSGVGFHPSATRCPSCTPASSEDLGSLSSTSSSVCVSSTTSPAKEYSGERRSDSSSTLTSVKRRRSSKSKSRVKSTKVEGIFMNWCCKLGVESGSAVGTACRAVRMCAVQWSALPFRVCLAASMWFGLRLNLEKSALSPEILKRLEEISGVPAKIILAAESKLEQTVRGGERRRQLEEGWAEC